MGDRLYAKRTAGDQVQEPTKTAFQRKPSPVVDPTRLPLWTTLAYAHQVPPSLRIPVTPPPHVENRSAAENDTEQHLHQTSPAVSHEEEAQQEGVEPRPDQENMTGLPDTLKAGVEQLSNLSMDDIHVHYNSPKPAQVQALAYTQGTEIHVGPGQERYLAHEAWHVVQQKQGRVQPTFQAKGVAINNEQELEREADVMGAKIGEIGARVIQGQGIYCSQRLESRPPSRQYPHAAVPARILQKYQEHPNEPYTPTSWAQFALNYRLTYGGGAELWSPADPESTGPNIASLTFNGNTNTRESAGIHAEQLLIGQAILGYGVGNPHNPAPALFLTVPRSPAVLYTEMAPCPGCQDFLKKALNNNDHVYYSVPYNINALKNLLRAARFTYGKVMTEEYSHEELQDVDIHEAYQEFF